MIIIKKTNRGTMNNYKNIKKLGEDMLKNANSTDEQVFGSFYLSRLLGFRINYIDQKCIVKFEANQTMFNPQG